MREPIYRYRTANVGDGHGGWTETGVTPVTVYGTVRVHENETTVIFDIDTDVLVGDLLRLRED